MQKADKEMLKINNKLLILQELKKWDLSRTEIAGITGLSNSTVSSLVEELACENYVFEKKIADSTGGRKPVIFSLNKSAIFVLTIKILSHRVDAAIVNLNLEIVCRQRCCFEGCNETVLKDALKSVIEQILGRFRLPQNSVWAGIGVSVPGLIDHAGNKIIFSSNLNIANFNLKSYLQNLVDINVYTFKDVDALMLGAYAVGNLKDNASFLYFLVDTGVGMSFMSNGKILQLSRGGMEIGHMQLDAGGPRCKCGKLGCVETFVSEWAAQSRYKALTEKSPEKSAPSLEEMVFKSNRGDAVCRKILSEQCEYLGRSIALGINIFSPNEVLIGGPLSKIKWEAIEIIKKYALENVLTNFSDLSVKFSDTADEADLIGMASMIINHNFFLSRPFSF